MTFKGETRKAGEKMVSRRGNGADKRDFSKGTNNLEKKKRNERVGYNAKF